MNLTEPCWKYVLYEQAGTAAGSLLLYESKLPLNPATNQLRIC